MHGPEFSMSRADESSGRQRLLSLLLPIRTDPEGPTDKLEANRPLMPLLECQALEPVKSPIGRLPAKSLSGGWCYNIIECDTVRQIVTDALLFV